MCGIRIFLQALSDQGQVAPFAIWLSHYYKDRPAQCYLQTNEADIHSTPTMSRESSRHEGYTKELYGDRASVIQKRTF